MLPHTINQLQGPISHLSHHRGGLTKWLSMGTLFHNKKNSVKLKNNEQNQINSALCASIIQLGKNMNSQFNFISKKIKKLEEKINSLEKVAK